MSGHGKRNRKERGSAIVEFAIVLPLLLFVLLSMVDFGRYFYVRISLSSSSFEIADAITRGLFDVNDDLATKRAKMQTIISDVSPGIASFAQLQSNAELTMTPLPVACPNPSRTTTVQLATDFNPISPFVDFFGEARSTSSMRCLG